MLMVCYRRFILSCGKRQYPCTMHHTRSRHVIALCTVVTCCCCLLVDVVPSGTFKTKDGKYVVIGGNGDSVYTRLMTALGRADMGAKNPQYATNSDRCRHEADIIAAIEGWVADHELHEVVDKLKEARVPSGEWWVGI